jgi:YidC/Oxa1 family membrane protein insertase
MHFDLLYIPVSWVLLRWHQLFAGMGMDPNSGVTWALSIIFLVVTARLLVFRVFVKQVHYQRDMQKMQPALKQLRERYKHDRAELNRQIMKFQQEKGFNPLAGCLPMFLQIPVFLGLYHVLRHLSNSAALCTPTGRGTSALLHLYAFTYSETCSAAQARLFGAPLAASFRDSAHRVLVLGGDATTTHTVILPLLIISAAATFATQLLVRANVTVAPDGPAANVQRIMLFVFPLGVMASGLLFPFPLGVLLYWFTSNLWTLAQQAYVIRFHPPTDDADGPGRHGDPPPTRGGDDVRAPRGQQHVPQSAGVQSDQTIHDKVNDATGQRNADVQPYPPPHHAEAQPVRSCR